jgi:preprotein translocase subunit SecY
MWYQKIVQIFKIKELRDKILFILFIFAIFRLMANIPIPGVDVLAIKRFFANFQVFSLLNLFTGGALEKLSIVMLGLGPYITAIVILQLLTMVFPSLEKMYKEGGPEERQKFEQYGRILTCPLAALQALGMITLFSRQGILTQMSPLAKLSAVSCVTAGTVLLMWLGELISEKKIGNGVSLLIFAGIVADFPNNFYQLIKSYEPTMLFNYLIFFFAALLIIAGVVFVNEGRRNIPVSYAKRVRGMRLYGGVSTYLPLNVNPAGVMPIIFALSILTFPSMVSNFLSNSPGLLGKIAREIVLTFEQPVFHAVFYFLLVVLFTFFYTLVTFDPKAISENLQKMGGFVPGIRPGKSTAQYLSYILNRVLIFGAIFLGLIAIMPNIVQALTGIKAFRFLVGGTSILIIVSVILETLRQIKAELEMREYETF